MLEYTEFILLEVNKYFLLCRQTLVPANERNTLLANERFGASHANSVRSEGDRCSHGQVDTANAPRALKPAATADGSGVGEGRNFLMRHKPIPGVCLPGAGGEVGPGNTSNPSTFSSHGGPDPSGREAEHPPTLPTLTSRFASYFKPRTKDSGLPKTTTGRAVDSTSNSSTSSSSGGVAQSGVGPLFFPGDSNTFPDLFEAAVTHPQSDAFGALPQPSMAPGYAFPPARFPALADGHAWPPSFFEGLEGSGWWVGGVGGSSSPRESVREFSSGQSVLGFPRLAPVY